MTDAKRNVDVESTDYAQREYGVTPAQLKALVRAADLRYRKLQRSGKLKTITPQQLAKLLAPQ